MLATAQTVTFALCKCGLCRALCIGDVLCDRFNPLLLQRDHAVVLTQITTHP